MYKRLLTHLRLMLMRRTHREVDEELEFHLARQVEANLAAGMPADEARRQAGIAFGGVERAREQCREERPEYFFETLLQDVRYALRGFRRSPVFTITVVVTLMLGIGAATAVFSVVDRILFRALPYAHAERMVSVGMMAPLDTNEFMFAVEYFDLRRGPGPFEAVSAFQAGAFDCDLTEQNPVRLHCLRMEDSFLDTFGV